MEWTRDTEHIARLNVTEGCGETRGAQETPTSRNAIVPSLLPTNYRVSTIALVVTPADKQADSYIVHEVVSRFWPSLCRPSLPMCPCLCMPSSHGSATPFQESAPDKGRLWPNEPSIPDLVGMTKQQKELGSQKSKATIKDSRI